MDAGRRQLAAGFPRHLAERARAEFALIDMHGLEPVDALPGFRGQVVIGIVHVDVLRVAAAAGQLDREQRRRLGRPRVVGVVGVERLAGMMRLPFSIWSLET